MMPDDVPLIVLAGPTASGKSALALGLAERLPVEIISADSAQVYRGMDIGTAKPSLQERAQVSHHLIDLVDPLEPYSAARFAADAAEAIAAVRARGHVPVIVGGTLLYLRALLEGLSPLPSADPAVRAELAAWQAREGVAALHAELARLDPPTAARLHPNDAQRILRALEIQRLSGEPASRLQALQREPAIPGPVLRFALQIDDRAALHARIARRFHQMLDLGLLDEVARLHRRGDLSPELPSIRSVGYRQLWRYLEGEIPLEVAVEQAIAATRQLAKRQLTWLRGETHWIPLPTGPEAGPQMDDLMRHLAL